MARLEEVRPLEGMWAPLNVRIELRQGFERWLLRSRQPRLTIGTDDMVDELSLLNLCQHYRLEYPGGATDVARVWDESEQRIADNGPTFDDLKRLGWVFFDGSRWIMQSAPVGTLSQITYPSPSTKTFLTGLGKAQLVAKTDTRPHEVQALAARISFEGWLERQIPTKDPSWLVARLWESLCPKPQPSTADNAATAMHPKTAGMDEAGDPSALLEADPETVDRAFMEWSAWCNVLGCAARWDIGWRTTERRYCREAAYRVLERQTLWGVWNNDAMRYAEVLEKTFAIPPDRVRYVGTRVQAPPRTFVSRSDWLNLPEVEHLMMERCFSRGAVSFAFGLLCSELEKTDIGPSITATATKAISFAADHPMALQQLLIRANAVPALLVDMLMNQRAVCLAAKLVIEWRPERRRDSDRNVSREAQTKAFAVQDALSFLAYHLDKGTVDLEEYSSLITWCYASTGKRSMGSDSRRTIGRQLLGMVAKEKEELQSAVLQYLVDQAAYEDNVPRATFAGVLNGLTSLSGAPDDIAFPVVALYSKFAQSMNLDWTDAPSLSAELAARLVVVAFAQSASDRDVLLIPFDSAEQLRQSQEDGNPILRSSIARTLRDHVRLLARAVSGWPDEAVPVELFDALQALISRSVIDHSEKGRIGALTDRYSPILYLAPDEGSPAQDLIAAWRRLNGGHQEAMLQTLAQSDDPVLLAELCRYLPAAAKASIQARLRQLKPGEASKLWTWPEVCQRIGALLTAHEYGLAREHLDETMPHLDRAPPQYRLILFGLELQMLVKEKNWTALDKVDVPSTLDEGATRQAKDHLDFYRATSQLLRPNGNLEGARGMLQRLAAQPSAASAYQDNVFAVAIQQLLGPILAPLADANKLNGERLLGEIDAAVAVNGKPASSHLLANRALLLIALQRPEDALESVAMRRRDTRSADLELVVALAKSEMGLRDEAMTILDAAIIEFGNDQRLIATKNDLQTGDDMLSIASASVAIDQLASIRAALQQLSELLPSQVGEVLGPPGRGVRGYLVRQVSRAVAALQHMAAMLRDRKNPKEEARLENDLNTAVREVLGASLATAKWDVSDQTLGGSTSNGNPGERDAVVRASGQEISIYEALVCSGLDRAYTKKHFDKLLSYGVCDIYFHVTYSYAEKVKPLLDYVRQMLEYEVPAGLIYLDCEILEPPDYETSGYIATYRVDHREVAVVFFIVDLKT